MIGRIWFVANVTRKVQGADVGECTHQMEKCAGRSMKWAMENTSQFHMQFS